MINPRLGNPYYIVVYYLDHDITNLKPIMKKAKKVNKLKTAKTAKAKKAIKKAKKK